MCSALASSSSEAVMGREEARHKGKIGVSDRAAPCCLAGVKLFCVANGTCGSRRSPQPALVPLVLWLAKPSLVPSLSQLLHEDFSSELAP